MKKLLLFFAALLPCFLAHSQEAEGNGAYAEFQVIPRFEFNPYFTPGQTGDGSSGYSFGNSSIYTLIEGAFSDNVSFTLSNHWLSMDLASLYTSTLYSNAYNWLDIATVDFSLGNWTFTLGKDCIATGGYEYDAWDVDTDYLMVDDKVLLASNLWYSLPSYQWGGKVSYGIGEHTNLALQMTTSPFGERPFASGLYCYSGKWDGNYGPFSNMWSASAVQRPDGGFEWLVALSNRVEAGDFTFGLDWYNIADVDFGPEDEAPIEFVKGNTFRPVVQWAPTEKIDCALAGNIYTRLGEIYDLNAGAAFHYRPFKALQVNAALGWDLYSQAVSAMVGVKVNFTFLSL